jgi:hydrogenase large subunit
MRTVRSFDPCLPCGVHMYLGGGRVVHSEHAPMGAAVSAGGRP